ncbi:MAG: hypothetical protein KKA07_13190, partial [Bacteroidetes bacterium]|nr:hypothetical protein [Patescibacteria group bacterium]MBU1720014.1 hypothetical protein [Bacteroidota bacterium]
GTTPKIESPNVYHVDVNLNDLNLGIYEIRLVRFHGAKGLEFSTEKVDFLPKRDFGRQFFEVIQNGQIQRTEEDISNEIFEKEKQEEAMFLEGLDIRASLGDEIKNYCGFVFVRDMLIGSRMRFDKYEILPFGKGLQNKDLLECTNEFLSKETQTGISFEFNANISPVSVVHFPLIIASNIDQAKNYIEEKTKYLLQALALVRNSSGNIFDIVVIDRENLNMSSRFTVTEQYRGNLLVGSLAGENSQVLEKYVNSLSSHPYRSFLLNLYKEAISEKSVDFQYVRFWQILETLAESRNYLESENLKDFEGNELKNSDKSPRKINGSLNIVYNLLKEANIGSSKQNDEDVNIWLALRNVVAHFGSIREWNKLTRKKKWAERGFNKVINGFDSNLDGLKSTVQIILSKELS